MELTYEFLETPCFSDKVCRARAVYSVTEEDGIMIYKLVHGTVEILKVFEPHTIVEIRRKVD